MFMMEAQQIYDNFHGSGAKGTSALEQAQQTSYTLAGSYQDDAVAVQKLINDIGSGWTGQASGAASQGLAPMAENLLATGQDLNTHQDLVYRQAHSFQRAVSQVQQVPPAPSMTDIVGLASLGLVTGNSALVSHAASMYNQVSQHNAVSQANVDAYNNYVQASKYNSTNLPTMSGTMSSSGIVPVSAGSGPQVAGKTVTRVGSTAPRSTSAGAGSAPMHGSGGAEASAGSSASPNLSGPTPTGLPPSVGHGVTTTSNVASPSTLPNPSVTTGSGVLPVAGPGSGTSVGSPIGFPSTGFPAEGEPAGRTPSNIGSRLAGGTNIPGEGAATGQGGETQRGGEFGRSGSLPVEDEGPVARGRTGGAGSAATAAAGAMGPGRGKAGEDAEHQRKVPLSTDPDVFDGTDPVGVQVLGETYEQYQARIARDSGQHG